METLTTAKKYIEWISAEDMHLDSKRWLSELHFLKDEHLFFEQLISSLSVELMVLGEFSNDKELIDAISRSCRNTEHLIQLVQLHERELTIMVDGINQLKEEKEYRENHRKLWMEIDDFLAEYRMLKTQLFNIIKTLKKEEKLRILIENNH